MEVKIGMRFQSYEQEGIMPALHYRGSNTHSPQARLNVGPFSPWWKAIIDVLALDT